MNATIRLLRSKFGKTVETGHKQMGLRALKDAQALVGRNDAEVARLIAKAQFHLPYAQAYGER